jgi:hypothetical protein
MVFSWGISFLELNMITKNENEYFKNIYLRLCQLKEFLITKELPTSYSPENWYAYLNEIKTIQGNSNNDVSFIATMMAKDYLERKFEISSFDAAQKSQGAPGLDNVFFYRMEGDWLQR